MFQMLVYFIKGSCLFTHLPSYNPPLRSFISKTYMYLTCFPSILGNWRHQRNKMI